MSSHDDTPEQESDPVTTTEEHPTRLTEGPQRPSRDALEVPAAFRARLTAMMRAVPQHPDETPTPALDIDEARERTWTAAWRNSVTVAQLDDKARWSLDQIERDLHPAALTAYIDALVVNMRSAAKTNLVLAGTIGCGKTSAALAAGRYAVEQGLFVRVVRHKHYLKWLQHPDKTPGDLKPWQIEKRYRDVDLLILDDLGSGLDAGSEASRHARAETMSLVEDRIDAGKATLMTTNLRAATYNESGELVGGLAFVLEERVLSRISERGLALTCTGPDRRGRLSW